MYGIEKNIGGDFAVGGIFGLFLITLSRILPAFTLAVPYIFGLSIAGQVIVTIFIASVIEEVFFRGALLGFLTKKEIEPAKIDSLNRVKTLIVLSFFLIGFIISNMMFKTGLVYAALALMSLAVYALWDKISTLNMDFHIANIITAVGFGMYHIMIYAGEISASAIMSVSSTFITAILVGVFAGYLVRWRKSLMAGIGLHMCLNALLYLGFVIVT